MRILVCVKSVPDPADDVTFSSDGSLLRTDQDGLLSELDTYALEQALVLRDQLDAVISVLSVGPEQAESAIRKALQMGADDGVLVSDTAIAGSDVFGTAAVILAAARELDDVGLIVCGMGSTDSGTGVLPALLAGGLGWPLLSMAASVEAIPGGLRVRRVDELGIRSAEAPLPAVLSVTDQSGEPRYPSFKDVLAAKKKTILTKSLAELGVSPGSVGRGAARVEVTTVVRNPDRAAGKVVIDADGSSVAELADFLSAAVR
jgi:electron transfer flavoprotein beta subunit